MRRRCCASGMACTIRQGTGSLADFAFVVRMATPGCWPRSAGCVHPRTALGQRVSCLPSVSAAPPFISPALPTAADIWYISPDSGVAPRFQNWSLSLQRELPWKFVAEAAYAVGSGPVFQPTISRLIASIRNISRWGTCLNSGLIPQLSLLLDTGPLSQFRSGLGHCARALRPYPTSWPGQQRIQPDRQFLV